MSSELTSLVKVRFVGENIGKESGVPIYELAETLTAVQRLIYRAYLEYHHLPQRNIREPAIRQQLALQIKSREYGSDIYSLASFLQTPAGAVTVSFMTSLLAEIALMGSRYVGSEVAKLIRKNRKIRENTEVEAMHGNPREQKNGDAAHRYILDRQAIQYYNEFRDLGNPVGGAGGVKTIEISFPNGSEKLVITPQFRKDVERLENYYYFGDPDDITGVVDRANVYNHDGAMVRLARKLRRKTKHGMYSFLNKKVFAHIKKRKVFKDLMQVLADYDRPMLTFHGRPIHRVGDVGIQFREFEVEEFDFA